MLVRLSGPTIGQTLRTTSWLILKVEDAVEADRGITVTTRLHHPLNQPCRSRIEIPTGKVGERVLHRPDFCHRFAVVAGRFAATRADRESPPVN